ncbi:hypothetical protein LTR95_004797 [Oleoguttula sp. CCFEE 5521]
MQNEITERTRGNKDPSEQRCHLLEIPPEIRLHIYDHLLGDNDKTSPAERDEGDAGIVCLRLGESSAEIWSTEPVCNVLTALAFFPQTCKLIWNEASPIVKASLEAKIYRVDTQILPERWTVMKPRKNARIWSVGEYPLLGYIRHLELGIYALGRPSGDSEVRLRPIRCLLEQISHGSQLQSLHISGDGAWPLKAIAEVLPVLDDLKCPLTMCDYLTPRVMCVRVETGL